MAKSRIKGVIGHQAAYDTTGVDRAMQRTLQGLPDEDTTAPKPTPRKLPKMTKVEKNYIKGTGNRPSAQAAVDKVRSRRKG